MIQLFDLTQLVTDFTRITPSTATIIDHIYTSNPENVVECFVPSYAVSDHFPVCFTRKISGKISKAEYTTTTYRCFRQFNKSSFLSDLKSDLESFAVYNRYVDEALNLLFLIIRHHLNRHAPLKTRRVKSKRLPEWLTPDILNARRMRDTFKRAKNWQEYKKLRNVTLDLICKAKKKHFSESIASQKDMKTIWKHFRSFKNKNNCSTNTLPEELIIDDELYTDSKDVAARLNEFFASICVKFNVDGDLANTHDLTYLAEYVNSRVPSHIHFKVPFIKTQQVSEFLHALDPSKATGIDGLIPGILKMAADVLAPSITALINKSIETATFLSHLKVAKIFQIYKSGTKADPTNYRPISILPTFSKIFEKHINKHLISFLNKYNLIHENQSGFSPKHSCQTALIKLIDQWMACIDKGDIIGTLFLDFRKAFDLVDHSILLSKLSTYKFSDATHKLLASYLHNRQQVMDSGKGLSQPANIKSGVPHGSVLGPT